MLSLHKNAVRAKAVAERYEAGLMWTDAQGSGVDWSTLRPSVVVNRFPRDYTDTELKLCGRAMADRPGFDGHYPRAYSVGAATRDRFVEDYALTACASLLHAFVLVDPSKYEGRGQQVRTEISLRG